MGQNQRASPNKRVRTLFQDINSGPLFCLPPDPCQLAWQVRKIHWLTQTPRLCDPCQLAWQVKEIDWLTKTSRLCDPCQLVWQVKKIHWLTQTPRA